VVKGDLFHERENGIEAPGVLIEYETATSGVLFHEPVEKRGGQKKYLRIPLCLSNGREAAAIENARGREDAALALLDTVEGYLLSGLRDLVDPQGAFKHKRKVRALGPARYEHLPVLQRLPDGLRTQGIAQRHRKGPHERKALLDQVVHRTYSITKVFTNSSGGTLLFGIGVL